MTAEEAVHRAEESTDSVLDSTEVSQCWSQLAIAKALVEQNELLARIARSLEA